jgi:hypothetical protein
VASYRFGGGGGVTRKVGTGGILGTRFRVLGSGFSGTRSEFGFWRTEKTRFRNDRLNHATYHHVDGYDPAERTTKECKA